jgi:hypothetical protein
MEGFPPGLPDGARRFHQPQDLDRPPLGRGSGVLEEDGG